MGFVLQLLHNYKVFYKLLFSLFFIKRHFNFQKKIKKHLQRKYLHFYRQHLLSALVG